MPSKRIIAFPPRPAVLIKSQNCLFIYLNKKQKERERKFGLLILISVLSSRRPHARFGVRWNKFAHTRTRTFTHSHVLTHTQTHSHILTHSCAHTNIFTHSHILTHTLTHSHLLTLTHTHTNIHTLTHIQGEKLNLVCKDGALSCIPVSVGDTTVAAKQGR